MHISTFKGASITSISMPNHTGYRTSGIHSSSQGGVAVAGSQGSTIFGAGTICGCNIFCSCKAWCACMQFQVGRSIFCLIWQAPMRFIMMSHIQTSSVQALIGAFDTHSKHAQVRIRTDGQCLSPVRWMDLSCHALNRVCIFLVGHQLVQT